jgi:sentrin-specific protease 8
MMLKDLPVGQIKVGESIPDLDGVTHMFVPVNDDDQSQEVGSRNGGSHWSLVLVSMVDGVAFYYDSIAGTNVREANRIINKLGAVLGMQLRFIPLNDTPQQENGSDCGVYVCMFMEHLLLHRLLQVRTNEKVSMSMGGKYIDAREGRKKMLRVIEERRREGEKRRS